MLARFLTRPSHLRLLTLISSQKHFSNPKPHHFHTSLPPTPDPGPNFPSVVPRFFSSNQNNDGGNEDHRSLNDDFWKISTEEDSVFGDDTGTLEGISGGDAKPEEDSWLSASAEGADTVDDVFKGVEKSEIGGGGDDWTTADGYKPWTLVEEEKGDQVFDFGGELSEMRSGGDERVEIEKSEEDRKLEEEEKVLSAVLQGKFQFFIFLLQPLIYKPVGT